MNLRQEVVDLARFVRAPRRLPGQRADDAPWVARLLLMSLMAFTVAMGIEVLLAPLADWAGIRSALPETATPGFVTGALLLAPIGEELVFRAGLRQTLYTLAIGPALLILAIAPWARTTYIALAGWVLIALAAHHWLAGRVFRRLGARFAFGRRFIANYAWVFWAYTIAFALMHVSNWVGTGPRSALLPLMVLPQLIVGIALGYVRLRDGLRSSMLLHLMVNMTALIGMAISI